MNIARRPPSLRLAPGGGLPNPGTRGRWSALPGRKEPASTTAGQRRQRIQSSRLVPQRRPPSLRLAPGGGVPNPGTRGRWSAIPGRKETGELHSGSATSTDPESPASPATDPVAALRAWTGLAEGTVGAVVCAEQGQRSPHVTQRTFWEKMEEIWNGTASLPSNTE